MVAILLGADNGFFYAGQIMHFSSPFTVFLIYHKQQKDKINKALNVAFDVATKIRFFFEKFEVDTLEQRKLYDLLNRFVDGVDFKDISYTLEQSRCFLNNDLYQSVKTVRICFASISISIDCLDLLKDNKEAKATIINDLRNSYTEIEELQIPIRTAMVNELKLT